jgi:hypothetical protein
MRTSTSRAPIDAVAVLAQPRVEAGWVVPGPAQLVLGGTSLQAIDDKPLEIDVLDERGSDVRVGVRLDHVRFALWTARSRLMGVLGREVHISASPMGEVINEAASATLRTGAHVHRLSRKDGYTKVRFIGSLEVEGWVPDDAFGDRGAAGRVTGLRGVQRKPIVIPLGGIIRTEPNVHARVLALAHYSMFVDNVEAIDDRWLRVAYSDNDVTVRGYYQQRSSPGATHPAKEPELGAAVVPNTTVPAQTCLYASDEAVGFVVGDRAALVEPSPRIGWFTVTLETPWGPIAFEARGPTESTLVTCGTTTP